MKALSLSSGVRLKNILYTTDFSPASQHAAGYAAELAMRFGAKLCALHVRPVLEENAAMAAKRDRRKLLETFRGFGRFEVLITEGNFWPTVAATIRERKIDLIVAGTRGRSGIRRLLLGSQAEEIFRRSPCPVLTVGPHSSVAPKPSSEIASILFATDFTREAAAAAPYALSFAREFRASLILLHVLAEPQAGDFVHPPELVHACLDLLRQLLPPPGELPRVPEVMVEQGSAAERILEVAGRKGAELIVLGARRLSDFPGATAHLPAGTAYRVAAQAVCPVLTVRA